MLNYIELYEKYKVEFKLYFQEKSADYASILVDRYQNEMVIESIANKYFYSVSQVNRILWSCKKFLSSPDLIIETLGDLIYERCFYTFWNKYTIDYKDELPSPACKLFRLLFFWFKSYECTKIPVKYFITLYNPAQRRDTRKILINKLKSSEIFIESNTTIKVFKNITEQNLYIFFTYTDEMKNYINSL